MNQSLLLYEKRKEYEKFTKLVIGSAYMTQLSRNNKTYRHVSRFILNLLLFTIFLFIIKCVFAYNVIFALLLYPVYLYFQSLLISGFWVHAHELSHNQIKNRFLNDFIGNISSCFSFMNFYSFQYAHRLHHRNIGNLNAPEGGAPVSLSGQKNIRHADAAYKNAFRIGKFCMPLWFLISWPLFIYYGDYCSWIFPFQKKNKLDIKSLFSFSFFILVNCTFLFLFPLSYLLFYLFPLLLAGNRVLAITYMHHSAEELMFFNEKDHNFYNIIMSTTDKDYGTIVNFFMMNNSFHIPHHLNPQIAYYDLPKASQYLRETIPDGLNYNYYPNRRFYYDVFRSGYEQRLDQDYEFYQIKYFKNQNS